MIDYSYVECSMASLTALAEFAAKYPGHRRGEMEEALRRGERFIRSLQVRKSRAHRLCRQHFF